MKTFLPHIFLPLISVALQAFILTFSSRDNLLPKCFPFLFSSYQQRWAAVTFNHTISLSTWFFTEESYSIWFIWDRRFFILSMVYLYRTTICMGPHSWRSLIRSIHFQAAKLFWYTVCQHLQVQPESKILKLNLVLAYHIWNATDSF